MNQFKLIRSNCQLSGFLLAPDQSAGQPTSSLANHLYGRRPLQASLISMLSPPVQCSAQTDNPGPHQELLGPYRVPRAGLGREQ